MDIPDPSGNFSSWAGALLSTNSDQDLPLPGVEATWRTWAGDLVDHSAFDDFNVADPRSFSTWQTFARHLAEVTLGS